MPIETFWFDEEQTIICQRLTIPLLITDFAQAYQRTKELDSDFVIVDARKVSDLPRGLLAQREPMTQVLNTSRRVVVTVGASEQLRVFASTFFHVAGYGTIKFVNTLEEAEAFIRQIIAERAS